MKKSNVIVVAVLLVVSLFLLWLWYYLGFNRIDEPLDLVLSILWWVVVLVVAVVVIRVERLRRERIRTVYVSDDMVFNSEKGSLAYDDPIDLMLVIENILKELKYDFSKNDFPNKNAFPIKLIVRTFTFNKDTWKGESVSVDTRHETPFENKEELFAAINSLGLFDSMQEVLASADKKDSPPVRG